MSIKKKSKAKDTDKEHVEVVYLPIEDLIPDEDNPNEMDEATFDALIEEIKAQGFDEPIHVRQHPTMKGKYQIGSGHHRTKAAAVLGLREVPAIIKGWSDREQKAALAKRNALRGNLNKEKMVHLYRELVKGHDPVQVQRELGFVDAKKFEKLYDTAMSSLPPKQKKKLAEAKETIKSVDDLSSVLNRIFKEAGSELDQGYMVFSFGGKNHHYFQIGVDTENKLQMILKHCEQEGIVYTDFVQSIVAEADLPKVTEIVKANSAAKPTAKATKAKPRKRTKKK
jgi:hypothetical protein